MHTEDNETMQWQYCMIHKDVMHKAGNALINSDKLLQKTQIYFSQFCISKNSEERLTDMMASSKRQKLPTLVPRFWLHTGHGSGFSPDSKLSRAYNQYT